MSSYTSHSHEWVYESGAAVTTGAAPAAAAAPAKEAAAAPAAGGKKKKKSKKAKKEPAAKQPTKKDAEAAKAQDKKVKACIKEGGKKGQDISGMAAFGCHFFLTAMTEPDGSMDLLKLCMEGANMPVDPEGEDRKGGAGDLAKIFFAASDNHLAILGHVPAECEDKATLDEFMASVLKPFGGKATPAGDKMAACEIAGNPDKNIYPLKLRDECIAAGFDFLRTKGLIMEDDSDDDINFADECGVDLNAGAKADY